MLLKFVLIFLVLANTYLYVQVCQARTCSTYLKTSEAGLKLLQRGYLPAAKNMLNKALHLARAGQSQHTEALDNLGIVYEQLGYYDRAQKLYELAIKERQAHFGKSHIQVATSLDHLGRLSIARGRYLDAERSLVLALALRDKDKSSKKSSTLTNLAQLRLAQGRVKDAAELCGLSLKVFPANASYENIASARRTMALINLAQSRYNDAEQEIYSAQAVVEQHICNNPILAADNLDTMARIYLCQGKTKIAETVANEAWSMRKRFLGNKHPAVAASLVTCGQVYLKLEKYQVARDCFTESLEITTVAIGINHPTAGLAEFGLAFCDLAENQAQASQQHFKGGMGIFEFVAGQHFPTLTAYQNLYLAKLWSKMYVVEALSCGLSGAYGLIPGNLAFDANVRVFESALREDKEAQKAFWQTNDKLPLVMYLLVILGFVACVFCIPVLGSYFFSRKYEARSSRVKARAGQSSASQTINSAKGDAGQTELVQSTLGSTLRAQRDYKPNWGKDPYEAEKE